MEEKGKVSSDWWLKGRNAHRPRGFPSYYRTNFFGSNPLNVHAFYLSFRRQDAHEEAMGFLLFLDVPFTVRE